MASTKGRVQATDDTYDLSTGWLVAHEDHQAASAYRIAVADLLHNDRNADGARLASVSGVSALGGAVTLNSDGSISFAAAPGLQGLAAGQAAVDRFDYTLVKDGKSSTATVTLRIEGVNDAPVLGTAGSGAALTEDAQTAASGAFTFRDPDLADSHSVSASPNGAGYLGSFAAGLVADSTSGAVGRVAWSFNADPAAFQHLSQGQGLAQSYRIAVADAHGGSAEHVVTVTLTGVNDPLRIIEQTLSGTVVEDAAASAAGAVAFADPDLADAPTVQVTPQSSGYLGALLAEIADTSTGDGAGQVAWRFDVDPAALQALRGGETLTQVYQLDLSDGHMSLQRAVTVVLEGRNDAAVMSGSGALAYDGKGPASAAGVLSISDRDRDEAAFRPETALQGEYGSLTLDASGAWTYTLDLADPAVAALAVGGSLSDTLTVRSLDGTEHALAVAVHRANPGVRIDFEGLGAADGKLPQGAYGFNWGPLYAFNSKTDLDPNLAASGYVRGAVSGTSVAHTVWGGPPPTGFEITRVDGGEFVFDKVWLTAAWEGQMVTLRGYNNGVLVDEHQLYVTSAGPKLADVDWDAIDLLSITQTGSQLVLDDFWYALV